MSTNPTRLGAAVWAEGPGAPSHMPATSAAATSAAIDPIRLIASLPPASGCVSERRPDRELEVAELVLRAGVQVDPVVYPDGAERGHPAQPAARRIVQVAQGEIRSPRDVRAPHLPDVDERRRPDAEEQRDGVFDVAEQIDVTADLGAAGVLRRDLLGLEAPD